MGIVDGHVHCGISFPGGYWNLLQDFNTYSKCARQAGISAAVMFPPVMEIYDRHDPSFEDTEEWRIRRKKAHDYILGFVSSGDLKIYPFLFVWNDFAYELLDEGFFGVKWHRHPDEPRYNYDDPRCAVFLEEVLRRKIPVVLEEDFSNTVEFVKKMGDDGVIIIPHCGLLNGGYDRIKSEGLWYMKNIYADTSLAPLTVIEDFISTYGYEKIIFGSDFPFGDPQREASKVHSLHLDNGAKKAVFEENLCAIMNC